MVKRLVMMLLGMLGGVILWPFLLLIETNQLVFPGYFVFSLVEGIVFGLVFGAIFGSFEGIVVSSREKALSGLVWGGLIGIIGGVLGILVSQFFLFQAAESIFATREKGKDIALVMAGGLSWTIIGLCVTLTEGIRSLSLRKLAAGLAGGLVGGLIGGIVLQALRITNPHNSLALLAGLVLFGLSLSFFYAFFENRFSWGSVKLLNGPLKNKEYHLVKSTMRIGSDPKCDIVLQGYANVLPVHAKLIVQKGKVLLTATEKQASLKINDTAQKEAELRREDIFAIGNAKFMYGIFV